MQYFVFIFAALISLVDSAIVIQYDTNGQSFFSLNNAPVIPRGSNYMRLRNASHHILFEPTLYHQWDVDSALREMNSFGYNYVRVFLECETLIRGFNLSSPGLPMNYTINVIDFLLRAANYNLSVMLTSSWNPANYQSIIDSFPRPANLSGVNEIVFHPGQAAAKAQFFIDLLQQIRNTSSTALETIFAIDIFNEISISVHSLPFSLTSGIVIYRDTAYDMANGTERQLLLDTASNIWMNISAVAIKSIAPSILVTASLFSPTVVGHKGFDGVQNRPPNADPRYPLRPGCLVNSLADYIDVHIYAGPDPQGDMAGAAIPRTKPILMGETGTYKPWYKNISIAAQTIKTVMIESLDFGYTGWGIWNWNTVEQLTFWTLTEQNNTLNNVLSPKVWPIVKSENSLVAIE